MKSPRRPDIVCSVIAAVLTLVAGLAAAQPAPPPTASSVASAALSAVLPAYFPAGSLTEAAVGGERGARLVEASAEATAAGLRSGDVVLAVAGIRLSGGPDVQQAIEAAIGSRGTPTFTVWRTIPGERPVVEPVRLGIQVVDEYAALPEGGRSAMRLAAMLANQQTLVKDGGGVVLLPAVSDFDTAAWLRDANPMPQASETAVREVVEAIVRRVDMPVAPAGERAAAADLIEHGQYLEAQERARRAMVQAVVDPAARADAAVLSEATRLFTEASRLEREEEMHRMTPEPVFGLVAEGVVDRIDAFLPQNTLLDVEAATGYGFAVGARVRLAFDSVPVLRDLFVLAKYGQLRHSFEDVDGREILATTLHQASAEVLYRPRVASSLRPFVSAGVGAFPLEGRVHCPEDALAFRDTDVGWLFGGGLDFFTLHAWHLRGSAMGSYRILHAKFSVDSAPLLFDCARNTPPDFGLDDLENGYYEFDMDGWQVGFMLTYEF